MGYLSPDEVKAYAGNPDLDETRLIFLIDAASRAIDRYCLRTFATATATRLYDFQNPVMLTLRDDAVSVSQVADNSGQTFDVNDYVLYPLSGPPYHNIALLPPAKLKYVDTTFGAVSVTGVWGYAAAVPDDVKHACMLLVLHEYGQFDRGALNAVSANGLSFTFKPDADALPGEVLKYIKHYRRVRIASISVEAGSKYDTMSNYGILS